MTMMKNGSCSSHVAAIATADDLDLHVITPNGDDLNYQLEGEDPDSGGQFQHDDDPEYLDGAKTFQETVFFPLDGSAPGGVYEFYVYNGHEVPDPARPFTIYVYEDDTKVATKRGRVENGAESTHYMYDYAPPEE
jgi:hypothetical protein